MRPVSYTHLLQGKVSPPAGHLSFDEGMVHTELDQLPVVPRPVGRCGGQISYRFQQIGLSLGCLLYTSPLICSIRSCICVLDNPNATLDDLMEHIKGPDFPTRGIITVSYTHLSTPLPTGSTGIFRATVSSISKARTLSTS